MDPSIEDFFAERSLFVTGGTGFLGKALLEKLLRSCPRVKMIYVLIRPYRGKNVNQRLQELVQLSIFDKLREEHPEVLSTKLTAVEGDVTQIDFGLSDEYRNLLQMEVSIIFHVAATVRFDQPVTDALLMNTRGTREAVRLAKQMKNLSALVHISTTYCNCDRRTVKEVVYPAPMDWKEAIYIAESVDPALLNILSNKYLGQFPNSYTFTKNLAEQLVYDECNGVLPAVIFRPSIVISTVKEPVVGWIDNFNGPVGLVIGIGKGVIRTVLAKKGAVADYMPVDVAIKAIIVACWKQSKQSDLKKHREVSVYNASSTYKSISMLELMQIGLSAVFIYPFPDTLWFPRVIFVPNKTCFYVNTLLKQIIPAVFVDFMFYMSKKKPIDLCKIQRKIYQASTALSYFIMKSWWFDNTNFLQLLNEIQECDKESFDFDFEYIDAKAYLYDAIYGGHKYLLNTDMAILPNVVKKVRLLYCIDVSIKAIFWMFVAYLIFTKWIQPYLNQL